MLFLYLMFISVTLLIHVKSEDWKCPVIAQKPAIECSCDLPHTLRCNGNKQALKAINRLLRNSSVSLLDCTLQGLKYLPAYVLRNVSLHGLVISSGEISVVHELAFSDTLTPLQALGLPNNQLSLIPEQAIGHLIDLERLDLSRNRIKRIDRNNFQKLTKLQFLDLSENRLEDISSEAFQKTRNLQILRLRGNRLNTTNLWKIAHAKILQELDVSANIIIGPLTIEMLPKLNFLQELYINHNLISSIQKGALFGCRNLLTLSLNHNQIDVIEDHAFTNLRSLNKLDLSHNRIVTVSNSSLAHLERLHELDLSYNFLRALNSDLVLSLIQIQSLLLDENDISIITANVFDNNLYLEKLTLTDNPLNCDCSLIWFMDWLRNRTQLSSEDKSTAVCTIPPHLENALLIELSNNYLHCANHENNDDMLRTSTKFHEITTTKVTSELQIDFQNFWFSQNEVYLQWKIVNFQFAYKCDALFIYGEFNNSEKLLETKPLKCHSDNFENPEILNIEFKRNSNWTLGNFYRFCLVLLSDNDLKNRNNDLVIGCSDLIKLAIEREFVEIHNNSAINVKANFTKFNKILAKIHLVLPHDHSDSNQKSICSLNLTLIELKRNFLLDHKHQILNNCSNLSSYEFQFDNNPNVHIYRLCVNFQKQNGPLTNIIVIQEKCIIIELPQLKLLEQLTISNLYILTFTFVLSLFLCLMFAVQCCNNKHVTNNLSPVITEDQSSEKSRSTNTEDGEDKDLNVAQQLNGYVKLNTIANI